MGLLQASVLPLDLGGVLGGLPGTINLPPPDAPGPEPPGEEPPPPPRSDGLDFHIQAQEQGNWCWAAVATSVANFYDGTSRRQCDLVNQRRSLTTCCSEPDASDDKLCNQADDTAAALADVGHHAGTSDLALTFLRVQGEIMQDRLIGVRIEWAGQTVGHAVVLDGYYVTDGGDQYVVGDDPSPGDSFAMRYEEFKNQYGTNKDGSWDLTHFTR